MKVSALEVPALVVTVTRAVADDPAGTVTVHDVDCGQSVGAAWPSNWATIVPLELTK